MYFKVASVICLECFVIVFIDCIAIDYLNLTLFPQYNYYPAERANTSIGPMRRAEVSIRCIGFFISTR